MSASCIFCRIVKGEIPSFKVVETAKTLAFLDVSPLNKGHTLVIPKVRKSFPHSAGLRLDAVNLTSVIGTRNEITRVIRRVAGRYLAGR